MYTLSSGDAATLQRFGGPLTRDLESIAILDAKIRPMIEVADSRIHGKGYHSLRDIAEGEWVMSAFGIFIGHQSEQHSIQQSMDVHIEPFEHGGKYLNHSCDGNLFVRSDDRGIASFYAKRQIQKGEEVTYHYSLTELIWAETSSETDPSCNCQTSKCEGIIKSFSMLTPAQQREFVEIGIVSQYLINWLNEQRK